MDWVQWYYVLVLLLGVGCGLVLHGDLKEGRHDFRITFLSLLLHLPMLGRVFGWF